MQGPSPSPSAESTHQTLQQAHVHTASATHSPALSPVPSSIPLPIQHAAYAAQPQVQPPTFSTLPSTTGLPPGFLQLNQQHDQPPIQPPAQASIAQDQVITELFRGLHHKVLQPDEAATLMQRYIDTDRLDLLCQGMIEYGIGVVSNQLRAQTDVTLVRATGQPRCCHMLLSFVFTLTYTNQEDLHDVLQRLPDGSRIRLAQSAPGGLVHQLVIRLNRVYDTEDINTRAHLSCYAELMARACSLGMMQLGGAIKAYKTLLVKQERAFGGILGLCMLMLRNWEQVWIRVDTCG